MRDLKDILWKIYPLHRTLVSDGTDAALAFIGSNIPGFKIETYAVGKRVWDWKIPERYVVYDAYLETEDGERVVDFKDNPLHIVSYSKPINKLVTWEELDKHLHYSLVRPHAIPWVFKYYERDWGFCLPKTWYEKLKKDIKYRSVIKSKFVKSPGLKLGTVVVGNSDAEILVMAHVCHPAQANDDAAGVCTCIEVVNRLLEKPLSPGSMSVRFLFGPETIGSIAYLSQNEDRISNIRGGIFVEMTGNDNILALQHSRQIGHLIDRIAHHALRGVRHREGLFGRVIGNDEKVLNGPGVNIPCISISRYPYPEYHTSDDNMDIISEDKMIEAADVVEEIIRIYASNYVPKRTFRGPAFLSGRGLWVDWQDNRELNQQIETMMMNFDGRLSIFEIAELVRMGYWETRYYVERFRECGLIEPLYIPEMAETA